ncbi:hypothetical protein FACS1894190_17570 [Spirochaetia bacterium]|nr:hypothetical protein FACS1894190_17570 [Spirochaetia bacterium]
MCATLYNVDVRTINEHISKIYTDCELVDDATGKSLGMFFDEETTEGAMKMLWRWIELYGIPKALYCDKKNAFVLTRDPTDEELLRGITKPKSHFGKACEKLGIEVIAADSRAEQKAV